MLAKSKIDPVMNETVFNFYRPVYDTQLAMLWKAVPPEAKVQLQATMPKQYNEVVKNLGE